MLNILISEHSEQLAYKYTSGLWKESVQILSRACAGIAMFCMGENFAIAFGEVIYIYIAPLDGYLCRLVCNDCFKFVTS